MLARNSRGRTHIQPHVKAHTRGSRLASQRTNLKKPFSTSLFKQSAQVVNHIEQAKKFYYRPSLDVGTIYALQESLGVHFAHNHSLTPLRIFPQGHCFSNLDVFHLISHSFGKKGENFSLYVDSRNENKEFDRLATPDPREHDLWPEDIEDFDPTFSRRVWQDMGYYLSHVPYSFVRDSIISSSVSGEVSARIVSDNAVSDLFLNNMMLPNPKKSFTNWVKLEAEELLERGAQEEIDRRSEESEMQFERDRADFRLRWNLTLLNAPGYRFENERIVEEFGGPRPSDLGLSRPNFLLADPVKRMCILAGVYDNISAMESLAYLTGRHSYQDFGHLLFPADVVLSNGSATMVIGNTLDDTLDIRGEESLSQLYAAHHSVWSPEGISKVWGGVTLETDKSADSFSIPKGTLIEQLTEDKIRISRRLEGIRPNVVKHPAAVILAVDDPEGKLIPEVSQISTDIAIKTMVSGLKGVDNGGLIFSLGYSSEHFNTAASPSDMEKSLRQLFEASPNTKVFIVNRSSKNAKKLVRDISAGKDLSLKSVSQVEGWYTSSEVDSKSVSTLNDYIGHNFLQSKELE